MTPQNDWQILEQAIERAQREVGRDCTCDAPAATVGVCVACRLSEAGRAVYRLKEDQFLQSILVATLQRSLTLEPMEAVRGSPDMAQHLSYTLKELADLEAGEIGGG